jgi:hypothetical protein
MLALLTIVTVAADKKIDNFINFEIFVLVTFIAISMR